MKHLGYGFGPRWADRCDGWTTRQRIAFCFAFAEESAALPPCREFRACLASLLWRSKWGEA